MTGIALFAIPAGIFASGFITELRKEGEVPDQTCPHCGKPIRGPGAEEKKEGENKDLETPFSPPE